MLSVSCKIIKSRKCNNFMVALVVKNLPPLRDVGLITGLGRFLEKKMATHFSILAWKIQRAVEPGRLQSMGLQRVAHD